MTIFVPGLGFVHGDVSILDEAIWPEWSIEWMALLVMSISLCWSSYTCCGGCGGGVLHGMNPRLQV